MLKLIASSLCLILFISLAALCNVGLRATPQKFRTFYSISDPHIPESVRALLSSRSKTARHGNEHWSVEPDALICTRTEKAESSAPVNAPAQSSIANRRSSITNRQSSIANRRDGTATKIRLSFNEGLPVGDLEVVAIATDGAVWAGGGQGLVRYVEKASAKCQKQHQKPVVDSFFRPWDRWQYFGGQRYLPSDQVTALAAGENGSMWVQTTAGVAHLEFRSLTLADKATYFEQRITERHKRHNLVADSQFAEAGNPTTSHQYPNDNDGLWTAIYVASQAFRYKVTREAQALDNTRKSVEAMLRLEAITGRPGFPARSFRHKDEARQQDGVWHFTLDQEWEWKADTSSDEIVGHFFAFSVVYDLAADEIMKQRLRGAVSRMADHLIDHGYNLTDIHNGPTRWGRYDEAYFETDDGREERALRSLELLSHLKVAYHMTGNPRYDREYHKLINERGYHKNTTTYLKLRQELNYSDEELAMLSYYPLFRYEKDPKLLAIYREGLEQWWVNIKREDNPLWIFIYQICNPGKRAPLEAATRTLYRIPMDLIKWSIKNSHRHDVPIDTSPERHNQQQTARLLSPDERRVMKWNSNPFQLDDQSGGRGEDDGAFFLLPYWMGRYHRFLVGR